MSDLPEINFSERKKKKKGLIPWIQSRLGFGSRGSMGGAGGGGLSGAANLGRAVFGSAAKSGASWGLGSLLAGKFGFMLTLAVVGAAIGTAFYTQYFPSSSSGTAALSSGGASQDNYVPAILRDTRNQGSALEMLKETNKGAVSMDDNAPAKDENAAADAAKEKSDAEKTDANAPAPGQDSMGQELTAKITGGFGGGLSTTMGDGGGNFSKMGGFGNKFNTGATGGKPGSFGSIGSGFQASPRFEQRKKMLAMTGSKRPVFSNAKSAKARAVGKGAFAQAKGIRSMQKTYSGTLADQQRSTQDKAWEGSTPEGETAGGTGVSPGGESDIVTSPSLDNTSSSVPQNEPGITATPTAANVSPWGALPQMAMMLIMMSSMLSVIGAMLIMQAHELAAQPDPTGSSQAAAAAMKAMGTVICSIAIGLAAAAIMIGALLVLTFSQAMMGAIYMIGGGVALAAGIVGVAAGDSSEASMAIVTWMAAIAGIISTLASMFNSL